MAFFLRLQYKKYFFVLYYETILMIFFGTTMIFFGVFPASWLITRSSFIALCSISEILRSVGSSSLNLIFPLKLTGYSKLSSAKYFSSYFGKASNSIDDLLPRLDQSSSQTCGAYGEITTASGSNILRLLVFSFWNSFTAIINEETEVLNEKFPMSETTFRIKV